MVNIIKPKVLKGFLAFILVLVAVSASAKKPGSIMTVDGEEVPAEEFIYLYKKNLQQQSQPLTLDEYLPLFEAYRLKVAEAKSLGLDTLESFRKEVAMYKRELLEPYITDTTFINSLVEIETDRNNNVVESSHIMIIRTNDVQKDAKNLALLDSLRNELINGADFIEMAKQYSHDKFSAHKGGYLGFTPAGTYPYAFETAVYETPEGQISEIVESHVGWHIIKSGARKQASEFGYPQKSIEEVKEEVIRKSASPFDSRFHLLRQNTVKNLNEKFPEINIDSLSEEEAYNLLVEAEENQQYETNPEYRNLVDEYTNGSLLFEVSVENVWNKASNDTQGLKAFYDANREKYKWESPHAKGILVKAKNDSVANLIKSELMGMANDTVIPFIRKKHRGMATAEKFNVEKGADPFIDNIMFGIEQTNPKISNFESCFVVEGRIVDQPEDLEDVKNRVINDYQEHLDREWVSDLRKRHEVRVDKKQLAKIKKTLKE